ARRARGALVARAYGAAGLDVEHPGVPLPGVVGVLVVPPATGETGPPLPTPATLRAVADYLTREVAPVGVRVVAAAPRYQRVQLEALVVLDPDRDRADVLRAAADGLAGYLHPLTGGDGDGWPVGGPIRNAPLTRPLPAVPGVLAVPRPSPGLDGRRIPPCTDQPLLPAALPWPERPLLIPVSAGTVVGGGSGS